MKNMDQVIDMFGVDYGEHFLLNDRAGNFFFTPNGLKYTLNGITMNAPKTLSDMLSGVCFLDDVYDNVGYGDTFWFVERVNGTLGVARDKFDIYDPMHLALYKSNNVFATSKAALRNADRLKRELSDYYQDCVRGYGDE